METEIACSVTAHCSIVPDRIVNINKGKPTLQLIYKQSLGFCVSILCRMSADKLIEHIKEYQSNTQKILKKTRDIKIFQEEFL